MDVFAPFIHWSFFAVAIVLVVLGDFVKRLMLPGVTLRDPTRQVGDGPYRTAEPTERISDATVMRWAWWRIAYYRTIPIHPVVVGGLIGLAMGGIAPAVVADKPFARVLYYAIAGAVCTWVYAGATQWAKKLALPT